MLLDFVAQPRYKDACTTGRYLIPMFVTSPSYSLQRWRVNRFSIKDSSTYVAMLVGFLGPAEEWLRLIGE